MWLVAMPTVATWTRILPMALNYLPHSVQAEYLRATDVTQTCQVLFGVVSIYNFDPHPLSIPIFFFRLPSTTTLLTSYLFLLISTSPQNFEVQHAERRFICGATRHVPDHDGGRWYGWTRSDLSSGGTLIFRVFTRFYQLKHQLTITRETASLVATLKN